MNVRERMARVVAAWRRNRGRNDALLITAMLAIVAIAQLLSNASPQQLAMHMLHRKLYYIPIMYAGYAFGWRGGLVVATAASLLLAPHMHTSSGLLVGQNVEDLYEILMYFTVGGLFGWLRDLEEKKGADVRQVSRQLERAYHTLEERAIQLVTNKDYTQAILRSITSAVVTVGPDGTVTTVNPAAERMLGMAEADIVTRPLGELFRIDGGLAQTLERLVAGPTPRLMSEVQAITLDGRTLHARVAMARMRDVGGREFGAVVTLEDVTEVRALTDQLIRADRLAALGELTAGVAHEVRNPLGVIRASVQLVEDTGGDPARVAEATRVIKQEIDRLDRVIKALLDFGRPSAPTLRPTDLREVVEDVELFMRQFAMRGGVEIATEVAPETPRVEADADQLKQVLMNLVSNAVQAMEGVGGRVDIRVWSDSRYVMISVTDTGPGMAEDVRQRAFDPFFSTRGEGTGLGLTIVHRIIDQHGGRIELESMPGAGARFTIALPIGT